MCKSLVEIKYDDLVRFHLKTCACASSAAQQTTVLLPMSAATCIMQKSTASGSSLHYLYFWMFAGCTSNRWSFHLESIPCRAQGSQGVLLRDRCTLVAERLGFCFAGGCTLQASQLEMWVPSPEPSFVLPSFDTGQCAGSNSYVAACV